MVSLTKLPRGLSRLSFSFTLSPLSISWLESDSDLVVSSLMMDSGLASSLMMVRGDLVGGVLKLVKGVLLLLTLADPGPGLSLRGLNTESEETLLS